MLSILPINPNDNIGKRKAEENGLFKPTSQQLSEATKIDVSLLNNKYKKEYSVTFEKAYNTVKKKAEDKKRNSIAQEIKENIENQWEETAVSR